MRTPVRPKMYWAHASWFHLVTHPRAYKSEAAFARKLFALPAGDARLTLLELGSGGGNNAYHLKKSFDLTLSDISPSMLRLSRRINPECKHVKGDMRQLRLGRSFDCVYIHDAISYMTSERDLSRAIKTAFVHCRDGGKVLIQPDHLQETFTHEQTRGGHKEEGKSLRYVATTRPQIRGKTFAYVDYAVTMREVDGSQRFYEDRHKIGVFSRAVWLKILREAGFDVRIVVDPWKRENFLCTKAELAL